MTASRRVFKRFVVLVTLLSSIGIASLLVWYFSFRVAPSCFDGKQNQSEQGTDCGGSCAKICEIEYVAEPLVVRETAFVPGSEAGEYDVLARVYNPNDALGAPALPYLFRLKDASGSVVAESFGKGFILPQETKTFLSIGLKTDSIPQSAEIVFPEVKTEKFSGYQETPTLSILNKRYTQAVSGPFFSEVEGTLVNDSLYDFRSVLVKVVLRDASGKPLAFNQTEMNAVRTRSPRDFLLRWPKAFSGEVAQVDVEPETDIYHEENFIRQPVEVDSLRGSQGVGR